MAPSPPAAGAPDSPGLPQPGDSPGPSPSGGWLGLGLSTNLSTRDRPHPYRLLDARPGIFDYVEYSAPLNLEETRRQASLFGELWERRARVPVLFHPVHLNLYGPELESETALTHLADHARAVGSPWVSNDVAWWHSAGRFFPGYLYLAPPLSRAGLADCAVHAAHVQAALDRPLALENPVVVARRGPLHVLEFMAELHRRTGAPLVLDLGHLLAFQLAAGLPPEAGLADFPLGAVIEIHLAGGLAFRRDGRGVYHDAHPQPVREELFALLASLLPRCPALRCVTYEADGHPEAVAALHLERLRELAPPRGQCKPAALPGGVSSHAPTADGIDPGGGPESSDPWAVFAAAYGGAAFLGSADPASVASDPAEGIEPHAAGRDAAGEAAERDLRLTTLAETLERALPLTRWLAAGEPAALRVFASSPELREGFRPPGRDVARSFARFVQRRLGHPSTNAAAGPDPVRDAHEPREEHPAALVLALETWAHDRVAAASTAAEPGPGCLALAPGVGFGVFPVDLTELVYAVGALREALGRHAEASGRFEAGALEVLEQVVHRAPRRPWSVAARTARGRLEILPVESGLAHVLRAAAGGGSAEPLVERHPAALRAALREELVRAGPAPAEEERPDGGSR